MTIYKTYDQQALDSQYNNRARVPDFEQIVQQWEQASAALRERASFQADIPYGPHPREILDIFPASRPGALVQVFFHRGIGARWKSGCFISSPPALLTTTSPTSRSTIPSRRRRR